MMRLLKCFMIYGCLPLLLFSGASAAEDSTAQKVDQILGETRKIIAEYMTWSEKERAVFWPAYEEYEKNLRGKAIEILKLIQRFYHESDTLSDEEAKTLAERYFSLRIEKAILWKNFVMGLCEILPPRKMLRLIEVEDQIAIGFNLKILSEVYGSPR